MQKLPLAKEELTFSKRETAGETIKVSVSTSQVDEIVELAHAAENISIETVDIGREVAEAPSVRTVLGSVPANIMRCVQCAMTWADASIISPLRQARRFQFAIGLE